MGEERAYFTTGGISADFKEVVCYSNVWMTAVTVLLLTFCAYYAYPILGTKLFEYNHSATEVALIFALFTSLYSFSCIMSSLLVIKLTKIKAVVLGLLFIGMGLLMLGLLDATDSVWSYLPGILVLAAGLALIEGNF